jgi:hypothetical protein
VGAFKVGIFYCSFTDTSFSRYSIVVFLPKLFLSLYFSVSAFLLSSMAPKKAVSASSRARTKRSDGSVDLSPLENRVDSIIFAKHEGVLRSNYEISPTVKMFYQAPGARSISGGDITLYERMFLAGLRLPFPEIARDFVLFLMIAPSQVMPNAWRYLFASYILWRLVLKKEMTIPQFFNIYRPRQTAEGMIELCVRHPPVFIKLKSGLTNNKFWEMQFFRVSGEWECPEGTLLPEDRMMPRTWQLLRSDRSDPPSLTVSELEDVKEISGWSAARVKAEKFEEVDFDNLVTEENLRQFLGYDIPRDKQLITKRGAVKKRNDAPSSPRPATKKRSFKNSEEVLGDVPAQKKQKIPLAASGARRTSSSAPSPRVSVEEGSASFRDFIPEVSPAPSFVLRDESGSEASFHGEQCAAPKGSGEGNVPEARDVPVAPRVKHLAKKRKLTGQDRMAQRLADAGRLWGKAVIIPSDPVASSGDSLEEMDEETGTPRDEPLVEESEVESTPRTPSSERPETPPPPEENRETGHSTPQASCSAPIQAETPTGVPEAKDVEEPSTFQEAVDQEVPGSASEVQGSGQPEVTPHIEVPEEPRIDPENVIPEAGMLPETSVRAEAGPSGLRSVGSEAAPSAGVDLHAGPSPSPRVSVGFDVLGRGLLGHPMEAIKNLIPEGYLGSAGVSSPEKIAQGILISHYQVSFWSWAFSFRLHLDSDFAYFSFHSSL